MDIEKNRVFDTWAEWHYSQGAAYLILHSHSDPLHWTKVVCLKSKVGIGAAAKCIVEYGSNTITVDCPHLIPLWPKQKDDKVCSPFKVVLHIHCRSKLCMVILVIFFAWWRLTWKWLVKPSCQLNVRSMSTRLASWFQLTGTVRVFESILPCYSQCTRRYRCVSLSYPANKSHT